MFYQTGIDITNDKQMFNFLKNHFTYYTMNSWNNLKSIANNMKLNRLGLSGDWCTALSLLETGEYENINWMVDEWCREHEGYQVFSNGRSSGYLVLHNAGHDYNSITILPEEIWYSDTYEDYKATCKEYYGSVKAFRDELVYYTKLVQDFDKLCDDIREYCDQLSKLKFEVIEMEKTVEYFNDTYNSDLELLGFNSLSCDSEGRVDISEISTLSCLLEAFLRTADRSNQGYSLENEDNGFIKYKSKY